MMAHQLFKAHYIQFEMNLSCWGFNKHRKDDNQYNLDGRLKYIDGF